MTILSYENIIILITLFVLGISFGSFSSVLLYRLPNNISIVKPNSYCPNCNIPIKPWHNIPIFGWLVLKGSCYSCKSKIPSKYILLELLTGLFFVLIGLISIYAQNSLILTLSAVLIFWILLIMSIMDIKYLVVYDILAYPLVLTGILYGLISGNFSFYYELAIIGFLFFIIYLYPLIRNKEIMGSGDVMPIIAITSMLGLIAGTNAFICLSVVGIGWFIIMGILGKNIERLPMIPMISVGSFFAWTYSIFTTV